MNPDPPDYITMNNGYMSRITRHYGKTSSTITTTRLALDTSDKPGPWNLYDDNSSGQVLSKIPKTTYSRVKSVKGTNRRTRKQQECCNPYQSLTRSGMSSPWTSSHNSPRPRKDTMQSL